MPTGKGLVKHLADMLEAFRVGRAFLEADILMVILIAILADLMSGNRLSRRTESKSKNV